MGHNGFVHGLLLAAGAGTRMGMPKALMRDADGTSWLQRSVAVLVDGGCDAVTVVLGARASEALPLVPDGATAVVADDWAEGMSASLRAGLAALGRLRRGRAQPGRPPGRDRRGGPPGRRPAPDPRTLSRATYDGRPGHPVVIGRDHWAGVAASATGDQGARHYLDAHEAELVECGDLATGRDQDHR